MPEHSWERWKWIQGSSCQLHKTLREWKGIGFKVRFLKYLYARMERILNSQYPGKSSLPGWHNGYCVGLENRFPSGFPGSIPGPGVSRNRSAHRYSVRGNLREVFAQVFLVRAFISLWIKRQNWLICFTNQNGAVLLRFIRLGLII